MTWPTFLRNRLVPISKRGIPSSLITKHRQLIWQLRRRRLHDAAKQEQGRAKSTTRLPIHLRVHVSGLQSVLTAQSFCAGEVLINRDDRKDIRSIQPLPTIPLPRRSLQCASLPVPSFEAPLSCLRADPKHQGLRRSGRAAQSPSRYNRWAAHRSR